MPVDQPQLVIADNNGQIYTIPFLEAVGMKGGVCFRLSDRDLIKLPHGSQMFMLPQRPPVCYDPEAAEYVALDFNPLKKENEPCWAVAAFAAPGYTITYNSAYQLPKKNKKKWLPLFAYGAVVCYKEDFYVTAVRVDWERRQDPRYMDLGLMKKNIKAFLKSFPRNRLIKHLENCALVNCCPAAKNFFLQRYEGPLPTSPKCNSQCLGCISYQPEDKCPVTQPRITFIPTPEEIAETALYHIDHVADPVVSFGQGCEGEPLLVADKIERAIRLIRKKTARGIINLNTNASRPESVARLCDAGLDSIRVSLNSFRKKYYDLYYQPHGYDLQDVLSSIHQVKRRKKFVSLNYLTMPGFTDDYDEYSTLKDFMDVLNIDMIQWRNLNFDPLMYFELLHFSPDSQKMLGIDNLIHSIHRQYPHIMKGYFNPSRRRMRRFFQQ
ncbi:MAG: radical SAM protein [Candidatus Omnitrophica bacterium]|nr:radical SAM protein [Candidatus Omnitrophota bacterium]